MDNTQELFSVRVMSDGSVHVLPGREFGPEHVEQMVEAVGAIGDVASKGQDSVLARAAVVTAGQRRIASANGCPSVSW